MADTLEQQPKQPQTSRRDRARTVATLVIGAVVAVFAVENLDRVDVNWVLGTWRTPLIIVIAVAWLLGVATGWLATRRRGARKRDA
jgi:uncharacterized integral membrane protein